MSHILPSQLLLQGAGRREALGISLGLASRYSTKPRVTHSFYTGKSLFEQSQELFVRVRYFAYFVELQPMVAEGQQESRRNARNLSRTWREFVVNFGLEKLLSLF